MLFLSFSQMFLEDLQKIEFSAIFYAGSIVQNYPMSLRNSFNDGKALYVCMRNLLDRAVSYK